MRAGVIVLVRMDKYLFDFTREGKKKEQEKQAGSGVVFTYLFHCAVAKPLLTLLKQYGTRNACGQGRG